MLIILLQNLNLSESFCNRTRLICCNLQNKVIDAQIITESHIGKCVFILHITLIPFETNLSFILKQQQFLIRAAFFITINKSQGQILEQVGIYLSQSVFSHSQLYVTLSRIT